MKNEAAFEILNKDIKEACQNLGKREIIFLVNLYYDIQEQRIGMGSRVREMLKIEEPGVLYDFLFNSMESFELRIKQGLTHYIKKSDSPVIAWLMSICGIAEIFTSGLMAHLDINEDATLQDEEGNYIKVVGRNPSSFWKYAGYVPGQRRQRGVKLNYNPALKRLCHLIGESFVKFQNNKKDFYGKIYAQYKQKLIERNENLEFKEAAEQALKDFDYNKNTDAYKAYIQGKLPKLHIHNRATRYTVKLFLCHLHQVMYYFKYNKAPKLPYILIHPDYPEHQTLIDIPNKPFTIEAEIPEIPQNIVNKNESL